MEIISIDELKGDSFYHFTNKSNLKQISEEGLHPIIGENAMGIEKNPKIFFSKGEIGILKVTEVWARWLINRIFGVQDRLGLKANLSKEEQERLNSEWMLTFLKGDYLDDQEKKEQLFDYLYKYLKERVYLVLELEEGKEFSSTDIDENKLELQRRQDQITTQFAKTMYGPFSDFDSLTMDERNMHTKAGEGVSRDKIKQVKTPDGKTDMLSIIIYEYDKHKDIHHSHLLLDDFIVYAKKRKETEEMLGKEGVKSDQDNINRIY